MHFLLRCKCVRSARSRSPVSSSQRGGVGNCGSSGTPGSSWTAVRSSMSSSSTRIFFASFAKELCSGSLGRITAPDCSTWTDALDADLEPSVSIDMCIFCGWSRCPIVVSTSSSFRAVALLASGAVDSGLIHLLACLLLSRQRHDTDSPIELGTPSCEPRPCLDMQNTLRFDFARPSVTL